MKNWVAILAVLALYRTITVQGFPTLDKNEISISSDNQGLAQDFEDFLKLIPVEQLKDLFDEYLTTDEDFGEALDYVMTDEFRLFVMDIESMSEIVDFINYLENAGLKAYDFVNKLNEYLEIPKFGPQVRLIPNRISGGVAGFIKDVKALLPLNDLKRLYKQKLQSSDSFIALIEKLSSEKSQQFVNKLMAKPKMQEIMRIAKSKGVNTQEILDFLTSMLGLKFPRPQYSTESRSLKEDLEDFLKLIPVDKIRELFHQYLAEDEDFGEALDYVMSDEFKAFVIEVESMQEVKELLNYLESAGLDAYGLVNKINSFLDIPKLKPNAGFITTRITGGVAGFIKDVKALIPMDKLKSLYKEKIQNSKDFASLIRKLSSPEFQTLVNKLMAKPKLQEIIKIAKSKGVNVQELFDLLTSMLGLKFPSQKCYSATRSLKEDLEDFMKLIPVDKIRELFYQYLAEDEDFGEALDYVMSDEFKAFVIEVESMQEVKELLNYLESAELDAYGFVNKINSFLDIPKLKPNAGFIATRVTGGVAGFIKDVKALIPMDKLKSLYKEKIQNSKEFASLIRKLSSPEFQTLVNKLMAKPKLQEIIKIAKSKGVNVQELFDLLTSMLGLKFPSNPVSIDDDNVMKTFNDILFGFPIGPFSNSRLYR